MTYKFVCPSSFLYNKETTLSPQSYDDCDVQSQGCGYSSNG